MNKTELIDKICCYARTNMSEKATSKITQFALGSCTVGIGRKLIEDKISPILTMCTDSTGNIDMEGLKTSIIGGFETSKQMPILGGLISLDINDAKDFFKYIGCPIQEPTTTLIPTV